MKLHKDISWWVPCGRITYSGTPKTKLGWIRETWLSYLGFWRLALIIAVKDMWKL